MHFPCRMWIQSAVTGLRFLLLDSADVSGVGTRDEPLGTFAWEAGSDRSHARLD